MVLLMLILLTFTFFLNEAVSKVGAHESVTYPES